MNCHRCGRGWLYREFDETHCLMCGHVIPDAIPPPITREELSDRGTHRRPKLPTKIDLKRMPRMGEEERARIREIQGRQLMMDIAGERR